MTYKEVLLNRVYFIIDNANKAKQTGKKDTSYLDLGVRIGYAEMKKFSTSGLSFILDIYGKEHPYYKEFKNITKGSYLSSVEAGIDIINNIKMEIENDWLSSVKAIISAEIFSDFMDMAEHLLENNYKDASAVMIGSVLEEHIRQLCLKNGIETTREKSGKQVPVSADTMNNDLAKLGIYNKLDQKVVTAQFDLRNKAAHGHYTEYDKSQVEIMYKSVLDFITRNPL